MKFVIDIGKEEHSSSAARFNAKYASGPYYGKYLYEVKEHFVRKENLEKDTNSFWNRYEFNIPEGTIVQLIGYGQDGPRGINTYRYNELIELRENAEVQTLSYHLGKRTAYVVGRLVKLVETKKPAPIDISSGF